MQVFEASGTSRNTCRAPATWSILASEAFWICWGQIWGHCFYSRRDLVLNNVREFLESADLLARWRGCLAGARKTGASAPQAPFPDLHFELSSQLLTDRPWRTSKTATRPSSLPISTNYIAKVRFLNVDCFGTPRLHRYFSSFVFA